MKKYWKSLEEYRGEKFSPVEETGEMHKNAILELFEGDQPEKMSSRRDFLKLCGFSFTTAAVLASCERPVQKAIPYLVKPEEITPGRANHYATTFFDGREHCPVIVRVRDGRPVKIEGNQACELTGGGTTARVQASLLNLYDDGRYQAPLKEGKTWSWEEADREIPALLKETSAAGKKVVVITSSVVSPFLEKTMKDWMAGLPGSRWVRYDSISASGMLEANRMCFGKPFIPMMDFGKARLIVGFAADFLGTWLWPSVFIRQYANGRRLEGDNKSMSRHIHFEAGMSVTGSNADVRIPVKPSWELPILAALYNYLAGKAGMDTIEAPASPVDIASLAGELENNRGSSLVVSGSNDPRAQVLVNAINDLLGNYGKTLYTDRPLKIRQGNDSEFLELLKGMESGEVGAVLLHQVNPAYDHPEGKRFADALKKTGLTVSLSGAPDETSAAAKYVCPDNHYLESWTDAEPMPGFLSLGQPVIHPIFKTRQLAETLMKWSGKELTAYEALKAHWETEIFPLSGFAGTFSGFWTESLQKGMILLSAVKPENHSFTRDALNGLIIPDPEEGMELHLYESIALGAGQYANNPWLQELPDPVSKVTWDNYLAVSPGMAGEMGLENGDLAAIDGGMEVPVLIQPGQAYGTASLALGYGRKVCGKVGNGVGVDAYPMVHQGDGGNRLYFNIINFSPVGRHYELAMTQTHHSMEGRAIVRETSLEEYLENPYAGNEKHLEVEKHHTTLYDEVHFDGHHWGLVVDLSACVGCNNCIVSCQAENNIAVVGRQEVKNRRIMHWMRIDRYYSEDPENPGVFHQPVMCQHCDNAPCENVCPVSATMHSNEGLNQVAYNRCIGTKYCINNCPYRVRRFNWFRYVKNPEFDFNQNSDLGRMVLNPDVTVRERGVVEKCTFCVQRIQEKKLEAKLENRMLRDGEIQPACVQSCPAGALVFGDLNDKESRVSKLMATERNYHLLEELHTLPSVGYLSRVRNKKKNDSTKS